MISNTSYKYYLVVLYDFIHFCRTFPLRQKSEVYGQFVDFVAHVQTQFNSVPKCLQANNGTEFINNAMSTFLSSRGILLRHSYPYTSQQDGKAEHMLRTINNTIHTLLIHASMPPTFWALKHLLQPLMCLIDVPLLLLATKSRTSSFMALSLSTPTFACLAVYVILTTVPQHPTNSRLFPHLVCLSGIPLSTRGTSASIFLRGV